MRQDMLIALDKCYSQGFKVQSMQPLTWILPMPLLTSADESRPNAAPWSLLERHCFTSQLERRGSWLAASATSERTKWLRRGYRVLSLTCFFPLCTEAQQNGINFLQNKSIFDSSELLYFPLLDSQRKPTSTSLVFSLILGKYGQINFLLSKTFVSRP